MLIAVATFGGVARRHGRHGRRVHRGRRRPDHRLPVRAGPGHADRADGRHGARRAARHPHQGPGGPGVHPPRRHGRPRQDRHGHHRPDDPAGGRTSPRAPTRRRCCGSRAPWSTPPSTPSPGPSPRAPRSGSGRAARRSRRSRTCPGVAYAGAVEGREVAVGRLFDAPAGGVGPRRRTRPRGGGRTAVVVGWDGVARGVLAVADAVKETSAEAVRELRALGLTPVLLTGDNRGRGRGGGTRRRHRRR